MSHGEEAARDLRYGRERRTEGGVAWVPVDLQAARKTTGYTQEDVAAALHVNRTIVAFWETGQRQPKLAQVMAMLTLYRLARVVTPWPWPEGGE